MSIRRITKGRQIVENKVRCKKCKTVLHSTTLDGVLYCRCGDVWISGGNSKTLRGGEIAFVEELSTFK